MGTFHGHHFEVGLRLGIRDRVCEWDKVSLSLGIGWMFGWGHFMAR